ncbi:MAG: hypothetical protein AUG49_18845 [Catenulispora sp. 13_1_20CM_3_70_7]|nr:MAG: hypothetical protein AUG49_18845 [Catenulispora sp. 13_1_20CM_3_70_7]
MSDAWGVEFTERAVQTRRQLPAGPVRAGFDAALDTIGSDPLGVGRPWHADGPPSERTYRVGSAGLIAYVVDEDRHVIVVTTLVYAG